MHLVFISLEPDTVFLLSPAMSKNVESLLDNMVGVGDAVLLEPLTEHNFLENLEKRFNCDDIYVSPT